MTCGATGRQQPSPKPVRRVLHLVCRAPGGAEAGKAAATARRCRPAGLATAASSSHRPRRARPRRGLRLGPGTGPDAGHSGNRARRGSGLNSRLQLIFLGRGRKPKALPLCRGQGTESPAPRSTKGIRHVPAFTPHPHQPGRSTAVDGCHHPPSAGRFARRWSQRV